MSGGVGNPNSMELRPTGLKVIELKQEVKHGLAQRIVPA
jgi:hypothetical protein